LELQNYEKRRNAALSDDTIAMRRYHRSAATDRQGGDNHDRHAEGAGFRVQGSGFRVQGSGFRFQGSGVQGLGFRVWGLGFRAWDLGIRV
jgi:hypothetical protein